MPANTPINILDPSGKPVRNDNATSPAYLGSGNGAQCMLAAVTPDSVAWQLAFLLGWLCTVFGFGQMLFGWCCKSCCLASALLVLRRPAVGMGSCMARDATSAQSHSANHATADMRPHRLHTAGDLHRLPPQQHGQ